jgi:hypothetical protein
VALSLVALTHFISDEEGAYDMVRSLMDAPARGSCLVLSQLTHDLYPENLRRVRKAYAAGGVTLTTRDRSNSSSPASTWSSPARCS